MYKHYRLDDKVPICCFYLFIYKVINYMCNLFRIKKSSRCKLPEYFFKITEKKANRPGYSCFIIFCYFVVKLL